MDAKVKIPIVAVAGAGSGISLGIFIGEVVARLTGQTGWYRFGVKAIVKMALFFVLHMISRKFEGLGSFGLEVASYGMAGSIIPDAFEAAFVGGLPGLAELVAVSARTSTVRVERFVPTERMAQGIAAGGLL